MKDTREEVYCLSYAAFLKINYLKSVLEEVLPQFELVTFMDT